MKKLGLIINPIAGMGGSVGLKGTDDSIEEAIRRGGSSKAQERTRCALKELEDMKEEIVIHTGRGNMGGDAAREMNFPTVEIGEVVEKTTAEDTLRLAQALREEGVDLILFAGGDGTARDLFDAIGSDVTVLGIPSGVKIHSPVYAISPKSAGILATLFLRGEVKTTREEEVIDIDEEQYRRGRISTRLYGYLNVPQEKRYIQNRKSPTPQSEQDNIYAIGRQIVNDMEEDTFYLIGAGTTTRGIMEFLNLKNTLLGVDLVYNRNLLLNDVYGNRILEHIKGKKAKIVVSITGGQGFLFGRGNQQITPEVIREVGIENIVIVATKTKLAQLQGHPLKVDTDDEELNSLLSRYYKVVTGSREYTICKVCTT